MSLRYESPTPTGLLERFWEKVGIKTVLNPYMRQPERLKLIKENGQLASVQELGKSNATAATLRNTANRFYLERRFEDALTCYNESICYAEPGSDQLGMGYANRSAVYYEQGEYEFALFNIDLAKRNNYPEKLMPKLLARELNCKRQIGAGHSKGTVPFMDINVETNPEVPFLAKGIVMKHEPKFRRGLYAERDFNAGDIILNEKVELCGVAFDSIYRYCNQCCNEFQQSLIPCPTCPFAMFCSEECRELNWKLYHRFECAVATKLCCLAFEMVFPRFFFLGLSQFDDDAQALMDFSDPQVTTASNPLQLDFTNLNRLDVFKALRKTLPRIDALIDTFMDVIAASFYTVFLMNPIVSAIISTDVHRRFFLRTLRKFARIAFGLMTAKDDAWQAIGPVGSLLNHSCDPNALVSFDSGHFKVIVLRPIRTGEQIFVTVGPVWWRKEPDAHFRCRCEVCDEGTRGNAWQAKMQGPFPPKAFMDMRKVWKIENKAEKINAIQEFLKRYPCTYPHTMFGPVMQEYIEDLREADKEGNSARNRAAIREKFVK